MFCNCRWFVNVYIGNISLTQKLSFYNFKEFFRKVQREAGCFITTIQTDHGGEFENNVFEELCASPRSPQENEVVEKEKSFSIGYNKNHATRWKSPSPFLGRGCKYCLSHS